MHVLHGTTYRIPIYEGFGFMNNFRKESIALVSARVYLLTPRRLTAGGNLRHKVRINPRGSDLLYLSSATFVKRYAFDISLHATWLSKWIEYLVFSYRISRSHDKAQPLCGRQLLPKNPSPGCGPISINNGMHCSSGSQCLRVIFLTTILDNAISPNEI